MYQYMVNWKKETDNVNNKINISFIDYNNIKFYTMEEINTYFNKNKDNTDYSDNKYSNYIKKEEKEVKKGNTNANTNTNTNKNNKTNKTNNTNNTNKDKYKNLLIHCYIYLNNKMILLLPHFNTSHILNNLII